MTTPLGDQGGLSHDFELLAEIAREITARRPDLCDADSAIEETFRRVTERLTKGGGSPEQRGRDRYILRLYEEYEPPERLPPEYVSGHKALYLLDGLRAFDLKQAADAIHETLCQWIRGERMGPADAHALGFTLEQIEAEVGDRLGSWFTPIARALQNLRSDGRVEIAGDGRHWLPVGCAERRELDRAEEVGATVPWLPSPEGDLQLIDPGGGVVQTVRRGTVLWAALSVLYQMALRAPVDVKDLGVQIDLVLARYDAEAGDSVRGAESLTGDDRFERTQQTERCSPA